MKPLTRLAVLSLLTTALLAPSAAASAGEERPEDGPLCWLLELDCEDDDDDDVVTITPVAPGHKIQGVAVDAAGKGVDNAAVQALDASTGVPVATALTYASPRRGGPQHGYFYLYVPQGVYDVVLVKRGFDASFLQDVNVTGKEDVSLGALELDLRDWPTSTVAEVLDPVVAPKQSVVVSAVIASKRARVTGGKVVVSEGRRVLAVQKVTKRDRGTVSVDVGRLPRGTHKLSVAYKGVDGLDGSTAKTVRVTVAKSLAQAGGRPLRP